jgi:type IV fimbrial biogenesis protein FimT
MPNPEPLQKPFPDAPIRACGGQRSRRAAHRAALSTEGISATSPTRRDRGFTTLELMVTVAIAAMLAAVAAPGMLDFIRSNRLSTAARQFDADLVLARREAIKRNTRVLVCPVGDVAGKCGAATTTAWTQGWLVCHDANADGDCDDAVAGNPNPIRKHGALDASLTLTQTAPAAVVRFNANGTQGGAGAVGLAFKTKGTWTGSKSYDESVAATGNVALAAGS